MCPAESVSKFDDPGYVRWLLTCPLHGVVHAESDEHLKKCAQCSTRFCDKISSDTCLRCSMVDP